MANIFEDLKDNQILPNKSVHALRNYIDQKYPGYPPEQSSKIFADALHKIIDQNIVHFDKDRRNSIKKDLLIQVSKKEAFSINAFDVFEACAQLDTQNADTVECLTNWLNTNQSNPILKESVTNLILDLKQGPIDAFHLTDPFFIDNENVLSANVIEAREILENTSDCILIKRVHAKPYELLVPLPQKSERSSKLSSKVYLEAWNALKDYVCLNFQMRQKRQFVSLLVAMIMITGMLVGFKAILPSNTAQEDTLPINYLLKLPLDMMTLETQLFKVNATINQMDLYFMYKEINQVALKSWLSERDSLLAEEPYFTTILNVAKDYNVNPLLLFAITGQEQSFVPKSNAHSSRIVNNPFNVYYSWEEYNTDLEDATRIASNTIVKLSKNCPDDIDLIQWINRRYAEDTNWHIGVSTIFTQLEEALIMDSSE